MILAAQAELIDAARIEHVLVDRVVAIGDRVAAHRFLGDFGQADAFDRGRGAGEVLVDERARQAHRVEDLRAAVRLVGADAHLGHDLADALADRLHVALANRRLVQMRELRAANVLQRLERDVGVDRLRAIACEHAEMMHLARLAGLDDEAGLHPQTLTDEVVMHRRGGERGGNRDPVGSVCAVGQHEDVVVLQHRLGRRPAHLLDREFDTLDAAAGIPADVDRLAAECAVERRLDRADLGKVLVGEDRLADFEPLVRARVAAQQVGARADHRQQAHHQFLADRVDRRVGDLCEVLLEVVEQQPRTVRQHRDRGVAAHRADRIVARLRHRLEEAEDVLLGVAERLLALQQVARRLGHRRQFGLDVVEVFQLVLRVVEPLGIGLGPRELGLQFLVLDDPPLLEIDEQHPAWLEPPLAHDVLFGERQHAAFRSEADEIVLRHAVARRTQTVAIERRADLAAVGEAHRRGAVPRLHQRGVVFVERAPLRIHQLVLRPRFGDQHHHRVGKAVSAEQQQLERVVEAGGVRLAVRDDRPQLVEIGTEQRRFHRPAAGVHPVHVAANRVDLPIVRHETVRVREPPAGERVRAEALVDETQCADAVGVAQIVVKAAHLVREQQPFVNDRPARKARDVHLGQTRDAEFFLLLAQGVLGLLADDDQLALESVLVTAVGSARDDALAHDRHRRDDRLAQPVERDRHVAPADEALTLLCDELLELLGHEVARGCILRHHAHRHGVVAGLRQLMPFGAGPLAEQRVRYLDQDARAISQQGIGADRAAMVEVGEDLERAGYDIVCFRALDVREHADAAGIVLVYLIVQSLGSRKTHRISVHPVVVQPLGAGRRAIKPALPSLPAQQKCRESRTWRNERFFATAKGFEPDKAGLSAPGPGTPLLQAAPLIRWSFSSASRKAVSASPLLA